VRSPESDPRYLGADPDEVDPERPAQLQAIIAEHEALGATFSTPGWGHLRTALESYEAETIRKLGTPGGIHHRDVVYALRERLFLVQWLLGLPADAAEKAASARQELYELIRTQEGDDDD
jgi:hypothetical protein